MMHGEGSRVEVVDVAIIGTGFGGLGMAVELDKAGLGSYVVLEAADGVGGTWRDNTYPGAACDVTSALYSFSFHPHVWSRKYPQQEEILEYIEEVVDVYGLRPKIRFHAVVTSMAYDERRGRWLVSLADGRQVDARVVISSVGQLNQPAFPDVEGVGSFDGPAFHSARWDHSVDLSGRRVGIIGTGASVIQFGPRVAEMAAATTIFQRSAPYVLPKPDPVTPRWRRRLYGAIPATQLPARAKNFVLNELFGVAILKNTKLRQRVTAQWRAAMTSVIIDEELRRVCTPEYELGCKRALISDDWYPMVNRDDVSIVTAPLARITPQGVVTADGVEHDLDVLIYGTGFKATDFLTPMVVTGRDGVDLTTHWAEGAHAFRGVATAGFPNLFMLYGPNTNLGANSIVYMLESQARYIAGLLTTTAHADMGIVEVRPSVEAAWEAMIAEKSTTTAWVTGCHSWYTSAGRNTNNWPDATWRYRRLLATVDLLDYVVQPTPATVDA